MREFGAYWAKAYSKAIPFIVLAVGLLLAGCQSTTDQYNSSGYASKFGVMAPGPNGAYRVYAETTHIYKNIDKDYAHGFEVLRKDKQRFMGYFEVRFPEPITISPELERAYTVLEGGRLIRSPDEVHWEIYSSPFWFSEDDPLGIYEITIYIDGEKHRTIQYEVVPFEGTLTF